MFTDMPLSQLRAHRSDHRDPEGLAAFWDTTLAQARAAGGSTDAVVVPEPTPLTGVDVYDVTFPGFDGQPIKAWLRVPAGAVADAERSGRGLPTVVQFVGYGGGRGEPTENLLFASCGFAHLHMDTRGQGSAWSRGATPDVGTADPDSHSPQFPGVMTRGITSPETSYYRRLFTDAARAVDAARTLAVVDAARVAVYGGSQGGAMAIAAGALVPDVGAVVAHVPFLCDIRRSMTITDEDPFHELVRYLAVHRDAVDAVHRTLDVIDGVGFARRGRAPARFTVGLMDAVVPPSGPFAAHAAWGEYAADRGVEVHKEIEVWPYNGHEGGGPVDEVAAVEFIARHLG
ncbi:cephalosporin-C deacetylase [Quadrisphaera granulorum]|uniref:Cephalosporin-C deacetylase n=1 Tax=Quadrisphaera granulorum TaxID=317664 RepID=A0A315ZQ81_9ACTN|nr:acetylxylan esterase [Quadrisphaera granulorum]PWJ47469.1 cephalosporin-C deacetylase [Quadrisphaera granulorum]SZE98770.1 cephalosporin-C deacetylase [Quadrisphaera granulorum]